MMSFRPTRSQLKVFSAIFSDLGAAWIISVFLTRDLSTLIYTIIAAIVSIVISIKIEDLLKEYD